MTGIVEATEARPLALALSAPPSAAAASLWWLGQAGFALRRGGSLVLIDPYLSNLLAREHGTSPFSHERLMPSPVAPGELPPVDAVLCSHAHGDHMDPETLGGVAASSPRCRFLLPRAEVATAVAIGIPQSRIVAMGDGDAVDLGRRLRVEAVPSAHVERERDSEGFDHFLGFIVRAGAFCLYHSGDCVPWQGLAERLAASGIDLALLPINGRDEERTSAGIVGNFNLEEAIALCRASGVSALVCHHYGLFAFNTVDPDAELAAVGGEPADLRVIAARLGMRIDLLAD